MCYSHKLLKMASNSTLQGILELLMWNCKACMEMQHFCILLFKMLISVFIQGVKSFIHFIQDACREDLQLIVESLKLFYNKVLKI